MTSLSDSITGSDQFLVDVLQKSHIIATMQASIFKPFSSQSPDAQPISKPTSPTKLWQH